MGGYGYGSGGMGKEWKRVIEEEKAAVGKQCSNHLVRKKLNVPRNAW